MRLGIVDSNQIQYNKLREWMCQFSIKENIDFELMHFENTTKEQLDRYAPSLTLVFVSLDEPEGSNYLDYIYGANIDCRICCYSKTKKDIMPLLKARPILYFLFPQEGDVFLELLHERIEEVVHSTGFFRHISRSTILIRSIKNVIYIYSELKYCYIVNNYIPKDKIFAKLSDIQPKLTGFIRIHQSYLINPQHIQNIDRKSHSVLMNNGDSLPLSDAYYDKLIRFLEKGENYAI